MGRLAFLLIGPDSLRQRWYVICGIGAALALLGGLLIFDTIDGVTLFATRALGAVFLVQALIALASSAAGSANYLSIARAIILLMFGTLILIFPIRNNLALTGLFAVAFIVDGFLRMLFAHTVRYAAWKSVMAFGLCELLLAACIVSDWPIPREKSIALCVSLSLIFSGWVLVRTSVMLKNLEPEVAILALPIFGQRAWYDNAPVLISTGPEEKPDGPMIVRIWTPVGSADVAARRPLFDRYIAAIDRNGIISTGHSAIDAPGVYISHHPGVDVDQTTADFMAMFRATSENDIKGRFQPSYAFEQENWCSADQAVVFHNYSLRRLRAFWAGYRQDNTYNLTNRNCSVAAASALDAALEGSLASRFPWLRLLALMCNPDVWVAAMLRQRAETMTWTPGYVLDYTRALHRIVERKDLTWGARLIGALRMFRFLPGRTPSFGDGTKQSQTESAS